MMIQNISDQITSPGPALTVVGSASAATMFGIGLPEVIQVSTAIYAVLLAVHKIWVMYKEFRKGEDASEK